MKWDGRTVMGVSGLVALAAQQSDGAVVYSDVKNQSFSTSLDLDIDGDNVIDFDLSVSQGGALYVLGESSNTIFGSGLNSPYQYLPRQVIAFDETSDSSYFGDFPAEGSPFRWGVKFERSGVMHAGSIEIAQDESGGLVLTEASWQTVPGADTIAVPESKMWGWFAGIFAGMIAVVRRRVGRGER